MITNIETDYTLTRIINDDGSQVSPNGFIINLGEISDVEGDQIVSEFTCSNCNSEQNYFLFDQLTS